MKSYLKSFVNDDMMKTMVCLTATGFVLFCSLNIYITGHIKGF